MNFKLLKILCVFFYTATLLFFSGCTTQKPKNLRYPLHDAAFHGDLDSVLALATPENVNERNDYGETPLDKAAENGHVEVIKVLLKNRANVNVRQETGETPLFVAATFGQEEAVETLLDSGAEMTPDFLGSSPVHTSVSNSNNDVLEKLLKEGANINAKDAFGNTPLHIAADENQIPSLRILLANNADIYAKNELGETAAHIAAKKGHNNVLIYLYQSASGKKLVSDLEDPSYGKENPSQGKKYFETTNNQGQTPLHIAATYDQADVMDTLLARAGGLDIKDNEGNTPLHLAVLFGHLKATKKLLDSGARINIKNNKGETPLDIVKKLKIPGTINLFE